MDGMKISGAFLTGIISKVIKKVLKKKYGCDVDIRIKEFNIIFDDNGNASVHATVDGNMKKEEILNILKGVGIG